jgi:SAM-dependent methyltransferase
MYLRSRLRRLPPGRFLEIGVGQGAVSRLLLDLGWQGAGWDRNLETLDQAAERTADAIADGRYRLVGDDWLHPVQPAEAVELVISSMVIEHLDDEDVRLYFDRAVDVLSPGGLGVLLVPGSPRHWGIEDQIAGHLRRYTESTLSEAVESAGWLVEHLVGLTYPLSNVLLRLSNRQVRSWEADKEKLSLDERTINSGNRDVPWKTSFPGAAKVFLNEATMRPFDSLQRRFSHNPRSLVLYCECRPPVAVEAPRP